MIKVGISAWTEKTLVESGWYPPGARDAESRLRYYAAHFPLVENDATYYALPTVKQAEAWRDRTPDGFTMDVKASALLTEHYTDAARLPSDLRESLPPGLRARRRLYPRDVGEAFVDEVARRFRAALEPLVASGRLGVVLCQFPLWFVISREAKARLGSLGERLPGVRIAVELRNATWMTARNRDETLAVLRDAGLAYVCVDEPQGFPSSLPPIAAATSRDVAVVRFHGRNAATWARATRSAAERFDWRYTTGELREWVPKIERLADAARDVHVVMNNCHHDFAVRNATEMAALLVAERHAAVAPVQ